ncbi:glycine cleavage system aminomethyltransferase GcvT [Occultella kanbiaonis]|uniref:glycine cleavage system aminomethyltransferase GcvT n=1 Tax=Occultella kanbiaonis TaxID=2675754 RepID=UPI001E365535|nr:glycine cleavage system aminomethyltransferase GcvT [Occultella kanbiaonis]
MQAADPGSSTAPSGPSSPLEATHRGAGATMTDFAGWQMPLRFAGDLAEHRAVRERAGLFDLSHMAQLEVTGPEAAAALDGALVSAASRLRVGRARYTMITAGDGGILDDLIVYRLDEHEFLVIANAANRLTVLDELTNRSEGRQVAVVDRTPQRALIAIQGPAAAGVLAPLIDADLGELKYYASVSASFAGGVPTLVARTGYTGEDGFELAVPAAAAVDVWARLLDAGAEAGVQACGLASRDSLRLEAGMPLYGQELTAGLTPYEVGLGRVVHLDHEFLGRDALAERSEHPTGTRLIGLRGDGRRAARAGSPVLAAGSVVGAVTSGVLSPTLGHPVAMALVTPATEDAVAVGQVLDVDVRGRFQQMTVVELPFYRRPATT